jgi:hypothetical protein
VLLDEVDDLELISQLVAMLTRAVAITDSIGVFWARQILIEQEIVPCLEERKLEIPELAGDIDDFLMVLQSSNDH